jgi:hypothetical protein
LSCKGNPPITTGLAFGDGSHVARRMRTANAPGRLAGESRWALPGRAGERQYWYV